MAGLVAKVDEALAAGYQRIKIKIKPGLDVEPVRVLREKFPRVRLMVDANSAYRLEDAPLLKALDAYYLIMIEQPLGWDDIFSHAQLQRQLQTPICLDECIHDVEHARAAIETRACQIINIKLGRVGGHTSARRIHDLVPGEFDSRVVRRDARIWHRPRAQYCDVLAREFLAAGRCLGQPPLLGRRHHRTGSRSDAPRNDSRAHRPRNWLRAAPRPD